MSGFPESALNAFLLKHGLAAAGEKAYWSRLTGGVSSDIWRVDLPGRAICVKRALPKLKVAANWEAPTSRNASEWQWLCFASQHEPNHVPAPLASDSADGLFAMQYLPPAQYPVWKEQLMRGMVRLSTASAVGALLARLHTASANNSVLAARFDNSATFYALRLEPYLLASAERHPDLAPPLIALAQRTAAMRVALVHGDVSPKNILAGPKGPLFLDAECAWYGDPAFDLGFCLNHLLLKCLARRAAREQYLASFAALTESYLSRTHWEPRDALEARASSLLPALLLARVDGKSPVEYLTRAADQLLVRTFAARFLRNPPQVLSDLAGAWQQVLDEEPCEPTE